MSTLPLQSVALIDGLRCAAAYRHPVEQIELLETHISWVILTGQYAYKVKKPVDFGFVDFTTLPRRERFCHEEVRLNRRLAPEIYLGVVQITGSPAAPRMAGIGEPIEFAVQMRQFPQEALLSAVLARRELTPEHIDALAREIAGFHTRTAVAAADSPFGGPEAARKATDEVLEALQAGIEPAAGRSIEAWCREEFAARRDALARRKQSGFVRECHGDLHLGNMLLLAGKPTPFDCLEFNEQLRWIDVASDVAFAVMDLESRGSPGYANRLRSVYLEETGDYDGLCVLRYYLVYRALVRAKVAWLRSQQAAGLPDEASAALAQCQDYVRLAERFTHRPSPWLAITYGVSGSGKSTAAQAIVDATGAVRIRSDVERKRLLGLSPHTATTAAQGAYSEEMTARTYARLANIARTAIGAGFSVIADATFLLRGQRRAFEELASELGVPLAILEFDASENVLREQIARRSGGPDDASEADFSVAARQLRTRESLAEDEQPLVVSMGDVPLDQVAERVLRRLGR